MYWIAIASFQHEVLNADVLAFTSNGVQNNSLLNKPSFALTSNPLAKST